MPLLSYTFALSPPPHPAPAITPHTHTHPSWYCDSPFGAVECPAILQHTHTCPLFFHLIFSPLHLFPLFSLHTWCNIQALLIVRIFSLTEDTLVVYFRCFILDTHAHANVYTTVLARTPGHEVGVCVCVWGGGCCGRQQGLKRPLILYIFNTVQFLYYSQCWFCYQSQTKM